MQLSTALPMQMSHQLSFDVRAMGGVRTDIRRPETAALDPSVIVWGR